MTNEDPMKFQMLCETEVDFKKKKKSQKKEEMTQEGNSRPRNCVVCQADHQPAVRKGRLSDPRFPLQWGGGLDKILRFLGLPLPFVLQTLVQ